MTLFWLPRCSSLACVLAIAVVTQHPVQAQADEDIAASVNEHVIRFADVYKSIESFPLGEQINMRQRIDLVIQSLVNEELLFQSVLNADDEWELELRNEIKSLVAERIIGERVRQDSVSDEEIREHYAANRDSIRGLHIHASHIRMKTRTECEQIMRQIDSEEAFSRLAKEHSLDTKTAALGGKLGMLRYAPDNPDALGFEGEFFKMKVDEMRVFESDKGCHLIRVTDIEDPGDPPFEQMRAFLKPRLEAQRERARLQALLEKLASEAEVTVTLPQQ